MEWHQVVLYVFRIQVFNWTWTWKTKTEEIDDGES